MQMWMLRTGPTPEEVHDRMNRFSAACVEFGVPNPYSFSQIHRADLRWRRLHPNAGPLTSEIMNRTVSKADATGRTSVRPGRPSLVPPKPSLPPPTT